MRALLILGIVLALCCPVTVSAQTLEQAKKTHIEKTMKTAEGQKIKAAVEKYSEEYKLDKNYVYAIAYTESSFNHRAVSSCGAKGTMQMLDSTFKARGGSNIWDIDQQIKYGCKHLAGLLAKYKGNVYLATSAYLMGGGAVDRYNGQTPPAAKHYVQRVFYHKAIIEGTNI